ncbi:hypothetical protein HPB49_025377 [Dermacentor silvarum]|uniref:Uncharacterized protein n=1 Tax=Dermacentor silvarum TaxID=543639 RepID=A0ACB8CNM6_DERSI|nr:hypothetical protein HPB49_025377 [Dermacentor silvarum]
MQLLYNFASVMDEMHSFDTLKRVRSKVKSRCLYCSKLCPTEQEAQAATTGYCVAVRHLLPHDEGVAHPRNLRRKSQKLRTRAENVRGGVRNQNKLPEISARPIRRYGAEQSAVGAHSKHSQSAVLIQLRKTCDYNKDGILTWDDFNIIAENYTKLQRRGKLEKEVFERWKSILERWWNELTEHADFNKDRIVEFDEWLKFFNNLGKSTKSVKDLPDFLQKYLHLFFLIMDSNKDGLICAKDYKKYLKTHNLDISRADECFKEMLNEEDAANGDAMTSDRFTATVYECWVSQDNNCKGKYICGPYDTTSMEELEKKNKKRPV